MPSMSGVTTSSQKEPKKSFLNRFLSQSKRTKNPAQTASNTGVGDRIVYPAFRNAETGSRIVHPVARNANNYGVQNYNLGENRAGPRMVTPASRNFGNRDYDLWEESPQQWESPRTADPGHQKGSNYDIRDYGIRDYDSEEEPPGYWGGPVLPTQASDDWDELREDIDMNVLAILLGTGGSSGDNLEWPSDWGWVYGDETARPESWEEPQSSWDDNYGRPRRRDTLVNSNFQAPRVREAASSPDLMFLPRPTTQRPRRDQDRRFDFQPVVERRNQRRDQEARKAREEAERQQQRAREAQRAREEAERRVRERRARNAQEAREQVERRRRIQKEREEQRLREEAARKERERKARQAAARREKEKALKQIGAWVEVSKVNQRNSLENGGPALELSKRNLVRLAWVRYNFLKHLSNYRIQKIQFVYNDKLYKIFEHTRNEFRRHGKPSGEMLLFHGTKPENVDSILIGGFRVGGVGGHQASNGSAWGIGIYCCTSAKFPIGNFNVGSNRLVCMRALPGAVSNTMIHQPAGNIGQQEYDSYLGQRDGVTTYVIRRSCQTLPCFAVYY